MKKFNIYKHPIHKLEAVKIGFSWPAFLIGVIWMLYKKLWRQSALIVLMCICLNNLTNSAKTMSGDNQLIVSILLLIGYTIVWLLPAFKGYEWREQSLLKRGFEKVDTLQADNVDAALALYEKSAPDIGKMTKTI